MSVSFISTNRETDSGGFTATRASGYCGQENKMNNENKRTIRAIPQGGDQWSIHIDGSHVSTWDFDGESSIDAIEDYAYNSGAINLSDFDMILDV